MLKKLFKKITKPIKKTFNKIAKALGPKGMKALAIAATIFSFGSMAGLWGPASQGATTAATQTAEQIAAEAAKKAAAEAAKKAGATVIEEGSKQVVAEAAKKVGGETLTKVGEKLIGENIINNTLANNTLHPNLTGAIEEGILGNVNYPVTGGAPITPKDPNIFQRIWQGGEGAKKGTKGIIDAGREAWGESFGKPIREILGGEAYTTAELKSMGALKRTAVNMSAADVTALNTANNFINPPDMEVPYPGGMDSSAAFATLQGVNTPPLNAHALDAASLATTNIAQQKDQWAEYGKVVQNVTGIPTQGYTPKQLIGANVFGATPNLIAEHGLGGFEFAR